MNKDKRPYIPVNYSIENSYAALFEGMQLNANNPVTKYLLQVAAEKYTKLGEIAKAALKQMYHGVQTGMTYETLLNQLARQIHGRGPSTTHFENKVVESISNLLAADLIYLSSSNDEELILSPVLRMVFGQNHEMQLPLENEIQSNRLFIGKIEVGNPHAEEIYNELIAKDLYLTEDQAKRFKYTTRIFPNASFTHEECLAFMCQYQLLHGISPTVAKFPLMQLKLIGSMICGTANVPDNSMFVGSTLAGRVVPPSEMFNVFEQISKDHRVADALAGKVFDTTHCMTVNFHGADWTVKIPEAYNYCVWFRDMTSMLLPEVKGPLLYLGNQVVSAEDSVAYYQDIKKEIFLAETLSKNYRYKPSIGALVGWSFTFEHIRQFKRDFDAMLVLTGNNEVPNQKTQVTAKFVLTGIHVPIHSAREVYDFLAGNADIQKYRTDPNGEDFAHADVVVNYRGNDQVITAAQGSKFMDDFKDLKKALKKPKVE